MKAFVWTCALALAVLVSPSAAHAQCMGGMMGGKHEHGSGGESKADKKIHQNIEKVLGSERGRSLLLEAILEDDDFMSRLIGRLAEVPRWRAMVREELGINVGRALPADIDTTGLDAPPDVPAAALYACPMHPEVTSSRPGDCSVCGMALERRER